MFLTKDDIVNLTGYRRPADQCRWLKSHGWKYEISAVGRPVVLRRHAESRMSDVEQAPKEWSPNFAAMGKAA